MGDCEILRATPQIAVVQYMVVSKYVSLNKCLFQMTTSFEGAKPCGTTDNSVDLRIVEVKLSPKSQSASQNAYPTSQSFCHSQSYFILFLSSVWGL